MAQSNLVYLTGAGASANALPTTATFRKRLKEFLKTYMDHRRDLDFQKGAKKTAPLKYEQRFQECLRWLIQEAGKHASIDTYAKKLIIRGERQKLLELKATLSAYFVLEQSLKPVDPRYDSFLASIVKYIPERPAEFPDNVKILTWNYDMQIEKAFFEYFPKEDQVVTQIALGGKIVRINGVAGTVENGHISPYYTNILKPFTIDTFMDTLEMFGQYFDDTSAYRPDIKFAWEQADSYIKQICMPIASVADILIVIGYSFPLFNREIDRMILSLMKNLKKIYVQLPQQSHHDIMDRLYALSDNLPKITLVGDLERFYVPYEF